MLARIQITFSENEIRELFLLDVLLEDPGQLIEVHAPVFDVKVAGNVVQVISGTLSLGWTL